MNGTGVAIAEATQAYSTPRTIPAAHPGYIHPSLLTCSLLVPLPAREQRQHTQHLALHLLPPPSCTPNTCPCSPACCWCRCTAAAATAAAACGMMSARLQRGASSRSQALPCATMSASEVAAVATQSFSILLCTMCHLVNVTDARTCHCTPGAAAAAEGAAAGRLGLAAAAEGKSSTSAESCLLLAAASGMAVRAPRTSPAPGTQPTPAGTLVLELAAAASPPG
jgi:hypothetical protein